jgi:lipoprotein-anchoring transpeptidase ErfK/SrfK
MMKPIASAFAAMVLLAGCTGSGLPSLGASASLSDLVASAPPGTVITEPGRRAVPESVVGAQFANLKLPPSRSVQVPFATTEPPGTIIITTRQPGLFFIEGDGKATRYMVAVGRPQHQWFGQKDVQSIHYKPAWSPPDIIKAANPNVPDMIPGGAPNNPMGVGALVLSGGEYAIHGTNRPDSIGGSVSFGCFRMFNEDIRDLATRVHVGTRVIVRR